MRKKIMIFIILAFPAAMLVYKNAELNRWARDGLIHNRVTIHGFAAGGLTRDEAQISLANQYQPDLNKKYIRFVTGEQERARLYFNEAGAHYDFSESVDTAFQYGRSKGTRIPARFSRKLYDINHPPQYIIDEEKVNTFINAIHDKNKINAVNASLSYENGDVTVVPGKYGRSFDSKRVYDQTIRLIKEQSSGEVELGLASVKPQYTSAEITFPISRLGCFSTSYENPEDDPRVKNIRIAAGRIHNQTVYPGEIFSASKYVASGKENSGYEKAIVLVNGVPTEDVGGGVCQVVTTLYNAILFAELPIVERHNHSAKVGYADYGFDATVAGDYYDLKFKNNTAYPLLVVSEMQNGKLEISLYGHENRPPGRSLVFTAELIETIKPEPKQIKKGPAVPAGETWVYTEARDGYIYDVYKQVFENGQLKGKEKVNSSAYKPVRGVMLDN